jgi:hypothetical protein
MLSDMYEYDGVKHGTYGDAVVNILGERASRSGMRCSSSQFFWWPHLAPPHSRHPHPGPGSAVAVTVCQILNLVLSAIGYTVAAGESLK